MKAELGQLKEEHLPTFIKNGARKDSESEPQEFGGLKYAQKRPK